MLAQKAITLLKKKVKSNLFDSFSRLFVPEDILLHFDVKSLQEDQGAIQIILDEKEDNEQRESKVVKNGYMNTIEIQSFLVKEQGSISSDKKKAVENKGYEQGLPQHLLLH